MLINDFKEIVSRAAESFKIDASVIEKDFYVFLILKELNEKVPFILFKGGTSLSKCYHIINRFSEDIDLSLIKEKWTVGPKKNLKYSIADVCNELNLKILNFDKTRSRRAFNRYFIEYPKLFISKNLKDQIVLETTFITKSYPVVKKEISCYITDYFKEINRLDLIDKFILKPFEINTQTLERTFIDKVYALCDYYLRNDFINHSRHIYDLNFLMKEININDEFIELLKEVKEERKQLDSCLSCKDGVDVNNLLRKIKDSKDFEMDYKNNDTYLLFEGLDYEEAIKVLDKIIELNIF